MHFAVKGRGLAPEKLERAIAPSVEKYGSALAMIAKTATITHRAQEPETRFKTRNATLQSNRLDALGQKLTSN